MQKHRYPRRQVVFYSLIGGLGVSLFVMEANWQMLRWAERQEGFSPPVSGAPAHLLEILLYTALTCLPLILITVAVCISKRVYRDKRGAYIIGFCATAVFLMIVLGSWLYQMVTTYFQERTLWLPADDFGSSLAYIWLWLCISTVMLSAWLSGAPKPESAVE
ncbi:hypothetical protein [Neisseria sp. CCUG12390]|uniref:hypothetical protein n=1 Tax=Neisseria sp. CCUG12390 TaxID=3392035 RepID=UPI003A0FEC73